MYAILHEGKSIDKSFFQLLLDELELDKSQVIFYGMGNKSNFFKQEHSQYEDLKLEIQSENVSKLLFIIDADDDFEDTEVKLMNIIDKLSFKNISKLYITCNPSSKKGCLESIILSSLSDIQKNCIEDFLKCSEFKSKTNDKSILNEIYKKAYPKPFDDFSHQNFNELKQKLKTLFEEQ